LWRKWNRVAGCNVTALGRTFRGGLRVAFVNEVHMQIFVTGATGFIGAHFTELALDAGHAVTGLYRSNGARHRDLVAHLRARGARLERGDILDTPSLSRAMNGAECVCHFAAAFREPGEGEEFFHRINVRGSANVARVAAAQGVRRFVHCGTAGIYGQRVSGIIDERTPIQPWNHYERSKLEGEEAVRKAAQEGAMEYVILRPTAVYGPRDERLSKLFHAVNKGRFPLFGRGEGRRHMVYVTDLAQAFLCACVVSSAANQEMIIAGPHAVSLRDLLETLARVANRRRFGPRLPLGPMLALAGATEDICRTLKVNPPIYRRRMDFYLNDAAFDSGRARQVLGWQPRVDLAEGLARTLRALRRTPRGPATAQVLALVFFSIIAMGER